MANTLRIHLENAGIFILILAADNAAQVFARERKALLRQFKQW